MLQMESIRSSKGYGKVNEAEDLAFRLRSRKRLLIIFFSAAVLLLLVIIINTVTSSGRGGSSGTHDSSPHTLSDPIGTICNVTLYPASCVSSISAAKGANLTQDPKELFKLSLSVAMDEISKVSSVSDAFALPSNDRRLEQAVKDCKELLDDAIGRLNDSLASLRSVSSEPKLTAANIDDLRTWLSAAVTDQETCLDGFEGTTGNFREKMEAAMANSTQFTSNSLAIATKILGLMEEFDLPIHRKLLGYPHHWVSPSEHRRAALEETAKLRPNVTVAADGGGEATTIQEAVDLVPKNNLYTFVIYVKEGVYKENVVVEKDKWNVVVVGDGMDKTIVDGSRNFIDGTTTFSTATFVAAGKNFIARDVGFRNSAGAAKHQAVALRSSSDHSVFFRCSFDGFQDTLYAYALRQFYRDCDIVGTVDFIFGDAAAVFQNCTIRPREALPSQQNTIIAQGKKDPNENTGISIHACKIEPYGNVTVDTYLGRPSKNYSTAVVMQTEIGAVVNPAGWLPRVVGVEPPTTIDCREYRNTGPGSVIAGRVKWTGYRPSISDEEAERFTVGSFINGSDWIPASGVQFESNLISQPQI